MSCSIIREWRSIQFRLLSCTHDAPPCGPSAHADELTKSLKMITHTLSVSPLQRQLSYKGVEFEVVTTNLTPSQTRLHDELAQVFRGLRSIFSQESRALGARGMAKEKGKLEAAFYSSQLRLHSQLSVMQWNNGVRGWAGVAFLVSQAPARVRAPSMEGGVRTCSTCGEAGGIDLAATHQLMNVDNLQLPGASATKLTRWWH